jgi:cysteine desulfurase
MRAGTEDVAAIAAFGAAATVVLSDNNTERLRSLQRRLEDGLHAATPNLVIFGSFAPHLPNTTLFSAPGLKAETAIIALDLEGFAVSSGAACSSGKVQPSHVLAAMGVDPVLARGAVRVSWGHSTRESDIEAFLRAWIKVSGTLLKSHGMAA